jgi:hypothetical protein
LLGPWEVTIKSFSESTEHRVLGTWLVHWVRPASSIISRWVTHTTQRCVTATHTGVFSFIGASEALVSSWTLASELFAFGASESLQLGATETSELGESEFRVLGSKQRTETDEARWLKTSQWPELFGAREDFVAAGSEEVMGFGSREQVVASEKLVGGAWLGASERVMVELLGGSEARLGGASDQLSTGTREDEKTPTESKTRPEGASEENLELGFPKSFGGNDGER